MTGLYFFEGQNENTGTANSVRYPNMRDQWLVQQSSLLPQNKHNKSLESTTWDYFFWGYFKNQVFVPTRRDILELKRNVIQEIL